MLLVPDRQLARDHAKPRQPRRQLRSRQRPLQRARLQRHRRGRQLDLDGGDEAPYNFTAEDSSGGTRLFSTRERPWGLLGGVHGDEWQVLINGVSPAAPEYVKFLAGRDWTYTNIQGK